MNYLEKKNLLLDLEALKHSMEISRVKAISHIENGSIMYADEYLVDIVNLIEAIRDRYFT